MSVLGLPALLRLTACLVALLVLALSCASCASTWGGSIGAVLTRDNPTGRVYLRDVPSGKPAAKAGLLPGDEIIAIEGKSVAGMSADDIHKALEGAVGSKVKLSITTREGTPREVTVERGPLEGASGS